MAIQELPSNWGEAQMKDGRKFYFNHVRRQTTWKRPSVAGNRSIPLPPPYHIALRSGQEGLSQESTAPAVLAQAYEAPPSQYSGPNGSPGERNTCFWITAGLGWVVWVFAVTVSSVQDWGHHEDGYLLFGVLNEDIMLLCFINSGQELQLCTKYEYFNAGQISGTIICSVAVVIFTVAFFRPFQAAFGSTYILSNIGAILMAIYAIFQVAAVYFFSSFVSEFNRVSSNDFGDLSIGPMFTLGIFACLFGTTVAIIVLALSRCPGDGPCYYFIRCDSPREQLGPAMNPVTPHHRSAGVAMPASSRPPPPTYK